MQDDTAPVEITHISKDLRLALGADNVLYPFNGLFDSDGNEVEEIEDAVFTTINVGMRWQYIILADFGDTQMVS